MKTPIKTIGLKMQNTGSASSVTQKIEPFCMNKELCQSLEKLRIGPNN
jgi:hypothetical protein